MAEIKLPKIALGAWAWGNDGTFGSGIASDELKPIFDAAMDAGLNLWDTAYAYGMGTSEKVLAGFLEGLPRESYLVSDKLTRHAAHRRRDQGAPRGRRRCSSVCRAHRR